MNETATPGEQAGDATLVKIRTPRSAWMWALVFAVFSCAFAAVQHFAPPGWVAFRWSWLTVAQAAVGSVLVGEALWIRTLGVDLTPESANVRGVRRRNIPWQDVQAVVQYRPSGAWRVRLILESGKPVTLRAPTTWSGFGGAQYERDFQRIGQWWLAHRGEAWRPIRTEAPQPPA